MPLIKNEEHFDIEGQDKVRVVVARRANITEDLSKTSNRQITDVRLEGLTNSAGWQPIMHMHMVSDLVGFHEALGSILAVLEAEDWMLD